MSSELLDFMDPSHAGSSKATPKLVITHGTVMILAWMLLASMGLMMPKHYRSAWKAHSIFGKSIWFQIHRPLMTLVMLLTCSGVIAIFIEVKGYSTHLKYMDAAHPILGIIVTVFTLVNPIMGFFRPDPNANNRPIFNSAHFWVGTLAYICAVVTLFLGTRLEKANMSSWAFWVLVAFSVWHIVIDIILYCVDCCATSSRKGKKKVNQARSESPNPRSGGVATSTSATELLNLGESEKAMERRVDIFITFVLGIYFLGLMACSITLVVDLAD